MNRPIFISQLLLEVSAAHAQPVTYLVFFDWDRATLTNEAQQVIHQAANLSHRTGSPVQVAGFTDTSGSVAYNNALSWRRVQAVAAEFERDGVPRNAIHAQGYGETLLRVPTPDEIREPQNRRVRITISQPVPIVPPPPVVLPAPYPVASFPFYFGFGPAYLRGGWGYGWGYRGFYGRH